MHVRNSTAAAAFLSLTTISTPSAARYSRPPQIVGPWAVELSGVCAAPLQKLGGTGIGAPIPVPGLRLGRLVNRSSVSFPTGGSDTGKATQMERRKRAGMQYEPKTFDAAGSARPEVYSADASEPFIYQHLPLKTSATSYDPGSLVFAHATSVKTGRIVSLQLVLRHAPKGSPKLRIVAEIGRDGLRCPSFRGIDVYAPATTAERIVSLFGTTGCNWRELVRCPRSDWPRGHVLFVKRQGPNYIHRWVDYDLLAKAHLVS